MKIEKLSKDGKSFGNGQNNPEGMQLKFELSAEGSKTILNVAEKFQGWPGVCHGGITATALDEAMGHAVVWATQSYCMSVELDVFYLAPVPTKQDLYLSGKVETIDERKVSASGEIRQGDQVLARAQGLYITVAGREQDKA